MTFVSSVTVPFFRDTTTTIQFPHKGLFREGMRKPRNKGPRKRSTSLKLEKILKLFYSLNINGVKNQKVLENQMENSDKSETQRI